MSHHYVVSLKLKMSPAIEQLKKIKVYAQLFKGQMCVIEKDSL